MNEFLTVIALAALPALGNFFGGLLAEFVPVSSRTLSLALHGAAGIILAVVGVELMPEALKAELPFVPILAFVVGGLFYMLVEKFLKPEPVTGEGSEAAVSSAGTIFFGVSVDLFSDGLMIGAGSTVAFSLALILALGQVSADIPEGFASIATFRDEGIRRSSRLLLSALFVVPVMAGAILGYLLLRGRSELLKFSLLAFTAGILVTIVVEDIVPEAHKHEEARIASLVFVCGFALFTLLSVYLG